MRRALLIAPGRNGRPTTMTTTRGSMRVALLCGLLAALGGADGEADLFTRANFGLSRYRDRRYPEPREGPWDFAPAPPLRSVGDEEELVRRLLPLDADRLLAERAERFSEIVDYERARLAVLPELAKVLLEEEEEEPELEEEEEERGVDDRFKGAELAERPDDFAYAPSDPRYFKNAEVAQTTGAKSDPSPVQRSEPPTAGLRAHASPPTPPSRHSGVEVVAVRPDGAEVDSTGVYVIAVVAGISAAATVGLIAVGIGWYNLQKHVKNASDVEYPAYGITGPNKDLSPSGDRRLAQSAQMYHYQHQKQQIIAMERAQPGERHGSVSEVESDEENEEGDYTVYECPGLAPTGEMEVKNPLFQDDPTPAAQTPAAHKGDEKK